MTSVAVTFTEDAVDVVTESDVDVRIPGPEEWVGCTSCGVRSYLHFFFMGDILPYCAHHGTEYMAKLKNRGASLVANYTHLLIEKRSQGEP